MNQEEECVRRTTGIRSVHFEFFGIFVHVYFDKAPLGQHLGEWVLASWRRDCAMHHSHAVREQKGTATKQQDRHQDSDLPVTADRFPPSILK